MMFNSLIELLRSDGSIVINKALAKNIGLNETIIYSELLSRYCYFSNRNELTADGYFFNTVKDLEDGTTLNDYSQRKAIKKLEELGLIKCDKRDIPAKRYFKIVDDIQTISKYLKNEESLRTSSLKFKELDIENLKPNNTNTNNTNKTISKDIVTSPKPIIKTKSKKGRKAKDIATMRSMINAFTQNEDIRNKLLEYFNLRLKKGLQPNQWQIILDDLRAFAGDSASIAVEKINNAIAGGYMQIIAPWEKDKKNNFNKPKFDNTAGRKVEAVVNMSEEEKKEFENNLATDEDGNLLEF
jgi:hypothetical protein